MIVFHSPDSKSNVGKINDNIQKKVFLFNTYHKNIVFNICLEKNIKM